MPIPPAETRFRDAAGLKGSGEGTRFVMCGAGDESWLCRNDVVARLLPSGRLPREVWESEGCMSTVKSGPHRAVFRVESPVGNLFVKTYRVVGWAGRVLHLVRRPAAWREWNSIRAIAAAGIPTVDPLAVGSVKSGIWMRESWLVTQEIEGVVPLDEFVTHDLGHAARPARTRGELATRLGRLIGTMHAAGFVHRDLHAGNVLVRMENGEPSLWLIDLHEIRRLGTVSFEAARSNLALFDHFFLGLATYSDRRRFFDSWRDAFAQDSTVAGARSTCRDVDAFCRAAEDSAFAKRDRKWRRGNRRLIVADAKNVVCRGLALLGKERLKALRDAPQRLAELAGLSGDLVAARLELAPRIQAAEVRRVEASIGSSNAIGSEPARHCWEMGHALLRRGIPTVRPILCIDRSARRDDSWIVLESPPSAVTLERRMKSKNASAAATRDSQPWILAAARVLQRLHARGFVHDDLSLRNVLIVPSASTGGDGAAHAEAAEVLFDGLEHVRQVSGGVTHRDRVEQLARLECAVARPARFSLTRRMRFLERYLAGPTWMPHGSRRWNRSRLRGLWRDVFAQVGSASTDVPTVKVSDRPRVAATEARAA